MRGNLSVNSERDSHLFSPCIHLRIVTVFLCGCVLTGCGYPDVSPQAYSIAKSLYSATNLKQTDRLNAIESLIEESLKQEELSDREAAYLKEIIETARAGDWEDAQQEVRELMEDQIGSSQTKSHSHSHSE
ncbi:MAG: hypothetical protein HUJ26_02035 [Planctomycetaceae bacterium]|nr:hypothetical protein [Planctomycetaceae bacterium]